MRRADIESALDDAVEIPPVVRGWVAQLLDPQFLAMLRAFPTEQVDVKLSASKGRVRKNPMVVLNGGPATYLE